MSNAIAPVYWSYSHKWMRVWYYTSAEHLSKLVVYSYSITLTSYPHSTSTAFRIRIQIIVRIHTVWQNNPWLSHASLMDDASTRLGWPGAPTSHSNHHVHDRRFRAAHTRSRLLFLFVNYFPLKRLGFPHSVIPESVVSTSTSTTSEAHRK